MDTLDVVPPPGPNQPPSGGATARPSGLAAELFGVNPSAGADPGAILKILRRRYRLILACVGIITAISAGVVMQITPRYAAETTILLDPRKTSVVDLNAVLSGLPNDISVLRGEIDILRSPPLAEEVVRKLNLTSVPEYNGRLRPTTMLAAALDGADALLSPIKPLLGIAPPPPPAEIDPQAELQNAAQTLIGQIDVTNDGRSYILKIRLQSENRKLAAQLANTLVDTYLQAQLESKFEAVRRANDWLNEHLATLRQEVQTADQAVQTFKAQHNITQVTDSKNGGTIMSQQLSELNTQLILASADRAQKEATLRQIQDQLKSGGVDAAAQVLASPLIQQLRKQQTDLMQQEAQLLTKYKPAHPAIINIKAQEQDLQGKIKEEIDKVVRAMAGDVAAVRTREAALNSGLQQLQRSSVVQNAASVQQHELERQAESTKTLYENFLNRFKQTSAQEDIQQADARIVARANEPGGPSYPRTRVMIGVAFLASILLGICAAIGIERLDNTFRTAQQVEHLAQVAALGLIPTTKSRESAVDLVVKDPMSSYSEAIRTVRTALRYSDIDNPPKVVLVTSALPQEGKSVTSLSLARSVAFSGGRSLIIDCDVRRPSIGKALKSDATVGLLSLFEPDADIRAAIQVDELSGMHFITSTAGTSNPQDLLGSKQFRSLIERLRPHYDMIVLDTPPVLAVSDALILSHLADATIFLVRWGRTPRSVTLGALGTFRQNGGHLAGMVLTRVDFRQHATYGFGDNGYYYGRYGDYYGSARS